MTLDPSMNVKLNGVTLPDGSKEPWGKVFSCLSDEGMIRARPKGKT